MGKLFFLRKNIVACGLACYRRIAPDTQHIILNLKGEADLLAKALQGVRLLWWRAADVRADCDAGSHQELPSCPQSCCR
jgi:hypothetical protein